MSARTDQLLHEAMTLTADERARLAAQLIASVDGDPDPLAEDTWLAEVQQRAEEAEANPDDAEDWAQVKARLQAALPRR